MSIAVYDTYVTRPDGRVMHFDILVPAEQKNIDQVLEFGRTYLSAKGVPSDRLRSQECRFCHMENSTPPLQQAIDQDGFAIIELQNCEAA